MGLRLGGWQRLGIVVSVVWALGASHAIHRDAARLASEWQKVAYDTCVEQEKPKHGNYVSM